MSPAARLILAAAALSVLAGCQRREEAQPRPAPDAPPQATVTPAEAAAPLAYDSKTQYAEVKLVMPDALKAQPDLHTRLYAADVRDLRQFSEGAQADLSEFGGGDLPSYSRTVTWTSGAETGKLFSLEREATEYTGGAHGNLAYSAVLWDKALKREVQPAQLFRQGADLSVLDRALCQAVNAARKTKDAQATPIGLDSSQTFSCPRAAQTPFVLAPSTTPGRAGGLTFLIAPYQVGPWSEGAYEVAVPQSAFRALLAPAYADEFAGTPLAKPA